MPNGRLSLLFIVPYCLSSGQFTCILIFDVNYVIYSISYIVCILVHMITFSENLLSASHSGIISFHSENKLIS